MQGNKTHESGDLPSKFVFRTGCSGVGQQLNGLPIAPSPSPRIYSTPLRDGQVRGLGGFSRITMDLVNSMSTSKPEVQNPSWSFSRQLPFNHVASSSFRVVCISLLCGIRGMLMLSRQMQFLKMGWWALVESVDAYETKPCKALV